MRIKALFSSIACLCLLTGCAAPRGTPGEAVNPAIVNFYSQRSDSNPFSVKKVTPGKPVEDPGNPTLDGKDFQGWSQTESKSDIWTFSTPIPVDATLMNFYGVWEDVISEITINFYATYPAVYDTKTAMPGGLITEPTPPTKSGYVFGGWEIVEGSNDPWDFDNDVVPLEQKVSMDFYAIWGNKPEEDVVVNFYSIQGDTTPYATQQKKTNQKLDKPTDPTRSGYSFNGWKVNGSSSLINFSTYVIPSGISSLIINGDWTEIPTIYRVEYYRLNTDTSPIFNQNNVKIGEKLIHPGVPLELEGKAFVGYQKQGETIKWDFANSTLVSADFTDNVLKLYAAWEDGFRIYFQAKNIWKQGTTFATSIYLWKGEGASKVEKLIWPGERMNFVTYVATGGVGKPSDYNIYSYDIIASEAWENIIFARINQEGTFDTYQTVDISLATRLTYNAYWINDSPTDNKFSGGWYTYTPSN